MKKTTLSTITMLITMLFIVQGSFAQPTCHSSFQFVKSDTVRVAIAAAVGHNLSELYDSASGFTWEAWINLADTNANATKNVIIGVEDRVPYEDIWLAMGQYAGTGAQLDFHVYDNDSISAANAAITGSYHLSPNKWYYVAAVCDYIGGTITLYLNGSNIGSGPIPFSASQRLTRNITTAIGNFNSQNIFGIDAQIDEVKFWKGVRSTTQILADSAGCQTYPQPGLVAYFRADERTGTHTSSFVNANFSGTNLAGWGGQAPMTICEPTVSLSPTAVSICTSSSTTISVNLSNLAPGSSWSVTLSDGSVLTGTADSSGNGIDSEVVSPATTTTYTIDSLWGDSCAVLNGPSTVVVMNCSCPANISVPSTACVGSITQLSITDTCACIDTTQVSWQITDSLNNTITMSGRSVNYSFPYSGRFVVCITWSDLCLNEVFSQCDTVRAGYCCICDMSIDSTSSTTDYKNGLIQGNFNLNSGSKNVVSLEISIPYFYYDFKAASCLPCSDFINGYSIGNFINPENIAGVQGIFAGCFNNESYAREIDWNFSPTTNINQLIKYTITIPPTASCAMTYEYCVKILIHYDDCSTCECVICFNADGYVCGCDNSAAKSANSVKNNKTVFSNQSVQIYPNPNGGTFTIQMDKTTDAKIIMVTDMTGKTISRSIVNGEVANFELNNIASGIYNVIVNSGGATIAKQVVIMK